MLWCLRWLIPLSLVLPGVAYAQAPPPTTSYNLHVQKERYSAKRPSSLVHLSPDQALLVFSPQPHGEWFLKRITDWDKGGIPKEESVAIDGRHFEESSTGFDDDLTVDAEGNYALIRISPRNIYTVERNKPSLVVLVDLRGFTIASRLVTSDPLIAASHWSFSKNGLLIATTMTGQVTMPLHPKPSWSYQTLTDSYEAAAFAPPDWKPSMSCKYDRVVDAGSNDRWHLGKVDDGCAALVASAQVPTAQDLPGGPTPPWSASATIAGQSCESFGRNSLPDFDLYGCSTGNDYLDGTIVTVHSKNLTVLSAPGGMEALIVPLPRNTKPYPPAVLANAGGHAWLLVLRDGITLEAYQLNHPQGLSILRRPSN